MANDHDDEWPIDREPSALRDGPEPLANELIPIEYPDGPATPEEIEPAVVEEASFEPEPVEETPEPHGPPGLVEAIENVLQQGVQIEKRLTELQTRFDREIRAEATREKVIDRLHAELQDYKHDLLLNTLRPVFIDLIQLHDDIGKVEVGAANGAEEDASSAPLVTRFGTILQSFQQGIEDILYRQGVEPFQVEGSAFDPRKQRAVSTVPSDDPALNKTVASRLRKGFAAGDRVIRPEIVSVYAVKK